MEFTDPLSIIDGLQEATATLVDKEIAEDLRIEASRCIRRLTQVILLNIEAEDWNRKEMEAMLNEADLGVAAMNTHNDIVEKEAMKYHQPGTTAKKIIETCRSRIFSVRQRSELFAKITSPPPPPSPLPPPF